MTVLPDVIVFNASQIENPAYKDEDSYAETICNILFDAVGLWCSGFHCDEDTIPGKIIVSAINWDTPPMDSKYLRVQDLSREQMIELKQNYYCEQHDDASYGELADIDLLVSDEEIYKEYWDTEFSPDDFACSAAASY